jgi:hypothetical protein
MVQNNKLVAHFVLFVCILAEINAVRKIIKEPFGCRCQVELRVFNYYLKLSRKNCENIYIFLKKKKKVK